MAPQTKADPGTVQKMLDITRTIWMNRTGIAITPGLHAPKNGRTNRHIRINRSIELMPFTPPGDDEQTTQTFIADPWAMRDGIPWDWEVAEKARRDQRIEKGRGPSGVPSRTLVRDPETEEMALIYIFKSSPTRKHWSRKGRRAKAALARATRRRNELAARA